MRERMSLSKYKSNRWTTHFARIARALLGPCSDVLREVLAKETSPSDLEKKVKLYILQNKKPSIIEQQKRLVYGKNYSVFDITLLCFLLRHMCSIPPHNNNWGKDPEPTDKSVSANIERIRILRNDWYGHATDFSLTDSDFEQKWNYISQIVKELEGYLGTGTKYQDLLIELKTCFMDPESITHYIDKLLTDVTNLEEGVGELQNDNAYLKEVVGDLQTDVKNLKEGVGDLQTDVKNLKEGVGDIQTDVKNLKEGVGELQNDNAYLKEVVGELQNDVLNLKDYVEDITKAIKISSTQESPLEQAIFEQWQQDNKLFISTKASEAVETNTRNQNLVIVTGHSGSGKSAIIQHIALKYRSNGWIVKPIDNVDEFLKGFSTGKMTISKTLFVFHDPIGKAYIDEIAFNRWHTHEETLKACLKKVKLIVSCRKYILYENRINGILKDKSNIVDISQDELKLNNDDKKRIWDIYSNHKQLSPEELEEILNIEEYFPLLCKLYFSMDRNQTDALRFFKEPKEVFEEEIRNFRVSSKEKYCSLVLLVLFNDVLNVKDILETDASREKFKLALELCELERTAPHTIGDALETLKGFLIKKVGDTYHFSHDFVMEVTTYVFGTDYPKAVIKYADIGLLRKNVRLQSFNNENNPLTIYLSNKYKDDLGKRLFSEMFGEHLLDVVLNPCLKDESITDVCMQELNHNSKYLKKLLEKNNLQVEEQNIYDAQESKKVISSRLAFMKLETETSPLNALIVFGHTRLSLFCIQALIKMSISLKDNLLFSSVCCNGSLDLFHIFLKDEIKEFLTEKWGPLYPIHIASAFHNSEILQELIRTDKKVDVLADNDDGWTPLILAAVYYSCEYDDNFKEKEDETKRNETVQLLLGNGANINLCDKDGTSPLYVACQEGHDSTVQLLLSKGADINLCDEDGSSPLSIACHEGFISTVQLLLSKGADINLCDNEKASPLFLACQEGHTSTVQLLLSKEANINLCDEDGTSPLYIACQEGHSEIVQHLLRNRANINLCDEKKRSSLYIACQEGHESIVQLLLKNPANVNLCDVNGKSPLFKACKNGDNEIIKLLIAKDADINLSEINGISPLYVAFAWRHCETVNILLECGADTSVLHGCGSNSLSVDCHNKDDQTMLFLLQSNNIIDNIYDLDSFFTLFVFCQVEKMLRMSE